MSKNTHLEWFKWSFTSLERSWSTNLIHGDIVDEERHDPQIQSCSWGEDDDLGEALELVVEVEMEEDFGEG